MSDDEHTPLVAPKSPTNGSAATAVTNLLSYQVVIIALLGVFTTYVPNGHVPENYGMMLNISVMIFVGFGYLMTFLRKYGYGAVGFTFAISAVVIEWAIINIGLWGCVEGDDNSFGVVCHIPNHLGVRRFGVGIDMIVQGLFAAAAVMISFGALIGKASFDQMIVLALVETSVYSVNCWVYFNKIKAADTGGSVVIHTFGAYFGLAATAFLTPKSKRRDFSEMTSSYTSDIFAFIGTVFLWIFWPSFNAVTADPSLQERAIVNTFLALLSSCIVSFFCSRRFRGEGLFDAVDIQNATLAGGVAMGTACTLPLEPYGACILGTLAGVLSCAGYAFMLERLEKKGVHDTCGVHNLHGMPGILGGLAGVLMMGVASTATAREQGFLPHRHRQWWLQLCGLAVTIFVAIVSGALTGSIVNAAIPVSYKMFYTDESHWTVPTGELSFTKNDVKEDAPRRESMRQRRSQAVRNWTKVGTAVRAASLLRRAASAGQNTSVNN